MTSYLTSDERATLGALRLRDSFVRESLAQVDRILASPYFARVQQKPKDFLGYVVAKTLLGKADEIKETTIAMAVFGESADFNPAETAKVRVAAGDLRERLAAYAQHEGRHDMIEILLPLNTYVPDVRDQRLMVVITEFENWHPHEEQAHLCAAITAEIAYRLEAAGLRAVVGQTTDAGSIRRRYVLRGSVESREGALRINMSLGDAAAGILWSGSFEGERDDLLRITGEMTKALLETLAQAAEERRPVPVQSRKRG
jgi:TolB-like protein